MDKIDQIAPKTEVIGQIALRNSEKILHGQWSVKNQTGCEFWTNPVKVIFW